MRLLLFTFCCTASMLPAQDSTGIRARKNTIKIDLTSHWLYRNAFIFSYERVTKPSQTFAITTGYQVLPPLRSLNSANIIQDNSTSGLKLGAEYRFYLKKENKYPAPRGVFIGPYLSYHNYANNRSIEVDNNGSPEYADLNTKLNIMNIGFQVGYQFVLNNRWAIDLVFIGPSVSRYSIASSIDGSLSIDPEEIKNEVLLAIMDRFPAIEELVEEKEFNGKGSIDTWAYGYRYQLQVGYHFGRKKSK